MAEETKQEKPVGKVIHWYDKVSVAVVKLASALKLGDRIKVKRGEEEFEDSVASMQLDHKPIDAGKKGQEVAVKLSQQAKEGATIFKA
jgi:putative protease